jgi:hypothetical protein
MVARFRQGSTTSEPMVRDDGTAHIGFPTVPVPAPAIAAPSSNPSDSESVGGPDDKECAFVPSLNGILGSEASDLSAHMDDQLCSLIIHTIDFPQLHTVLLDIAQVAGQLTDKLSLAPDLSERHPLNETAYAALNLWVACTISRSTLLAFLALMYKDEAFSTDDPQAYTRLLERFLPMLFCKSRVIRRETAYALRQVCVSILFLPALAPDKPSPTLPAPAALFLHLLLSKMPESGDNAPQDVSNGAQHSKRPDCAEYFDLLCALTYDFLQRTPTSPSCETTLPHLKMQGLVESITDRILNHVHSETSPYGPPDTLFMGFLKLLVTLCSFEVEISTRIGDKITEHIFTVCLFPERLGPPETFAAQRPPACQTEASRRMAYTLLCVMCEESPSNVRKCVRLMSALQDRAKGVTVWGYSPSRHSKSTVGLVGLKNLSNICYMNSTLQLFYMHPSIREGVLALTPSIQGSPTAPPDTQQPNLITELQRMFVFLTHSEKMDFSPEGICKSMSTDVSVQQDAQQFFLNFLDRIEIALKGTGHEDVFARTLRGTVISQLIPKEYPEIPPRENEEMFYCLSLEVTSASNLKEAMDNYVRCEEIKCESELVSCCL